ncbi:MAG: hypothetical protein WDN10_02770 [bacterium]
MALVDFDLKTALGADTSESVQRFAVYLPNQDRDQKPVENFDKWVDSAMEIMVRINGGVTQLPLAAGRFRVKNEDGSERIVGENTVVVYSYLFEPDDFVREFDKIKRFIDTFGKITNQKSVMVEFSGLEPSDDDPESLVYCTDAYMISKYPKAVAIEPWKDPTQFLPEGFVPVR